MGIVLTVAELLEPGLREILDDWDIISSHPGDDDWLKWDNPEVIIAQYELAFPHYPRLSAIAPLVALVCTDSYSVEASCLKAGASRIAHIASYPEELLAVVDEAIEGSPPLQLEGNPLSDREREVLELMADVRYMDFPEIASELGVDPSSKYIYNISHRLYRKLGVSGVGMGKCRQAAVEEGRRRGWI